MKKIVRGNDFTLRVPEGRLWAERWRSFHCLLARRLR